MSSKLHQLGKLSPRYNFFLNPYSDARFSRCPQCEGKTAQKKTPLLIHVDPQYPINLNYTCRYCPKCDLMIAHKNEIEFYLQRTFSERNPEVIGNDYFVMGTTERAFWKEGLDNPHSHAELLANLHGFKQYLNFKMIGGWLPNDEHESKPLNAHPQADEEPDAFESESVDNLDEAIKLVDKMKKHLPIFVRPSSGLVKMLRRQGVYVDRYKQLEIHSVLYMGNEAGIACDITPMGREDTPVICSLTQLEIMGDDPLAQEMKAYQQERTKNLARYPGNAPIGFTVTPRHRK